MKHQKNTEYFVNRKEDCHLVLHGREVVCDVRLYKLSSPHPTPSAEKGDSSRISPQYLHVCLYIIIFCMADEQPFLFIVDISHMMLL
jgi:hypothetical protein